MHSAPSMFQSARQIIGFPKCRPIALDIVGFVVSICKADYWLPQKRQPAGVGKRRQRVSICKADYWLPQARSWCPWRLRRSCVSICKADYWLPQVVLLPHITKGCDSFNLQGRLLASPSPARRRRDASARTCFNLQGRLLASPRSMRRRANPWGACFNLQGRLLASPSSTTPSAVISSCCCFNLQGRLLASPSLLRTPSGASQTSFNLQGRLLASPRPRPTRCCMLTRPFQSARQIIGFPKYWRKQQQLWQVLSFNLQGRLLASPRSVVKKNKGV